jgi:hypothetical protein
MVFYVLVIHVRISRKYGFNNVMATRPLTIDIDGHISRLPDGVPLQVNPAMNDTDAPQLLQMQASIQATLEMTLNAMFDYRVQYSTNDIQAGVAKLPTGCIYLVYE